MVQWDHFVKYRQNPASGDMSPDLGKINWRCTCTSNKTQGCVNSVCVRVRVRARARVLAHACTYNKITCTCVFMSLVGSGRNFDIQES
jgi:hypothetical protein